MANEVWLIDANVLIEKAYWHGKLPDVGNPYAEGVDAVDWCDIENAPTIDPESLRPRGRWFENHHVSYDDMREEDVHWFSYICAECNGEAMCDYDYCPNCGAKMEG